MTFPHTRLVTLELSMLDLQCCLVGSVLRHPRNDRYRGKEGVKKGKEKD